MDLKEKARRCQDFVDALDEERRKILHFQRELPLSLQLINQTIESYKRMVDAIAPREDEPPVLKEFISLKPISIIAPEELNINQETVLEPERGNWLSDLRISHESDSAPHDLPQNPIAVKAIKNWGDDIVCNDKEKESNAQNCTSVETTSAGESDQEDGTTGSDGEEKAEIKSEQRRKARRCWSMELHKRFMDAIQQLGGAHVATPKQIRELMKVDGLTNDEVKSHLQKFRLHSRRTSSAIQSCGAGDTQPSQFVVGIWIPSPDYAAVAPPAHTSEPSHERTAITYGRYAPVLPLSSTLLFQKENQQ